MQLEKASKQIRVYESDYRWLKDSADKRRTMIAEIVHEAIIEFKQSLKT